MDEALDTFKLKKAVIYNNIVVIKVVFLRRSFPGKSMTNSNFYFFTHPLIKISATTKICLTEQTKYHPTNIKAKHRTKLGLILCLRQSLFLKFCSKLVELKNNFQFYSLWAVRDAVN